MDTQGYKDLLAKNRYGQDVIDSLPTDFAQKWQDYASKNFASDTPPGVDEMAGFASSLFQASKNTGGGLGATSSIDANKSATDLATSQAKIAADALPAVQAPVITNTNTTKAPVINYSGILKQGGTTNDANVVKQVQGLLGGLAVDGVYGSQTKAAVIKFQQENGLVADGVVGPKTIAIMNAKNGNGATTPMAGAVGSGVPGSSNGSSLVLPTGSSNDITTSYFNSLKTSADLAQINLDNTRQQQLDKIQQDKQRAQEELNLIRDSQADGIAEQGNASLNEKKMILDRLDQEEKRFNENYNIAQGLATKLTDLMTEGNNLIAMISGKTGLSGIRNPRINQAIQGVTAAVGVVKAGLDAANGQMGAAQNQLQTATNAITSAYTDQLDYYKSLNNFYESQASDASAKAVSLSKDERNFLDSKIAELEANVKRTQANSDYIQQAMMHPDTALAFASSGVTLNDTPEQIGAKLAIYAYSKELSDQSKEMANDGWTPVISGSAPAGATTTQRVDSQGKTKTYWKKETAKASGGSSSGALGILDIQRYQETFPDAGVTAGDTEATANAKVQAINSPEVQMQNTIQGFKDSNISYKDVVKQINESSAIKDKSEAIKIADIVYNNDSKNFVVDDKLEQDVQKVNNRKNGGIDNRSINEKKSELKAMGYTNEEIDSSSLVAGVDKFIIGVSNFLFGK